MFPTTLFDYNGVLVDDEVVHLEAFRDVLTPLGVSLGEHEYWERYLGFDDAGAFRAILTDAGRPPSDAEVRALIDAKRPRYLARAAASLHGFAGAAALVERRASIGPVVIVSGALRSEIELGLEALGVSRAVSAIVSAEDARASKPDPEGYFLGIDALTRLAGRAAAESAVVIEDSLAGVQAAKTAGLACIGVGHSYEAEALGKAGADWFASDLDAITDLALRALYDRVSHARD